MWQLIKRSLWILLLASGLQSSWAFGLKGPAGNGGDAWQIPQNGFSPNEGPKNLGEEYRQNTPVLYWTFDQSFYDFFGTNGVSSLRGAFAVYNALTNVDDYSASLSEFSLESRHINFQAQALGLVDLKTYTIGLVAEQLGLANPVEYSWVLHDRFQDPGTTCPNGMEYLVVQRNYDYAANPWNGTSYSPYVNNVLYDYQILEYCTTTRSPMPPMLAEASPYSVDPLADTYSPVGAFTVDLPGGGDEILLYWGNYYTGLTRDDMMGLRYLLTTNNVNWEAPAPGALLITTNLGGPYPMDLTTSDLGQLLLFAQTNNPALIPAAFPNVAVSASSFYQTRVTNWIVNSYFTNLIGAPVGSSLLVLYSNSTIVRQLNFVDTFANVITNGNLTNFNASLPPNTPGLLFDCTNVILNYSPNTAATIQTVTLERPNGAPYGTVTTNTIVQNVVFSNQPSGEYLVLPPSQCGWKFLCDDPIPNVVATTNVITQATNTTAGTNAIGFVGSVSVITYFTNHNYSVYPINCVQSAPTPGLYEGIGRVQFVEADYDSLIGQYFQPFTNIYTMTLVTNSQTVVQHFQRVITAPDILFSAADNVSGGATIPAENIYTRSLSFDSTRALPGLAGPGTVNTPVAVTFDKSGPVYYNNSFGGAMDGTPYFTQSPGSGSTNAYSFYDWYFVWSSFDGTTNTPVVYPNTTTLDVLQNQILIQVSPSSLPDGHTEIAYDPVTISATGGSFTQPYTWTASGLPPGLSLTSNSDSTATLSGTPAVAGTFDFVLTLTDDLPRSVQFGYTITIQ